MGSAPPRFPNTPPAPYRLTPAQLLSLQLHARGYAYEQIAVLVAQPPAGVASLLALAAADLDAPDVPAAIALAKRRGLIL